MISLLVDEMYWQFIHEYLPYFSVDHKMKSLTTDYSVLCDEQRALQASTIEDTRLYKAQSGGQMSSSWTTKDPGNMSKARGHLGDAVWVDVVMVVMVALE